LVSHFLFSSGNYRFSTFGGIGLRQSRQAQEMKALGAAVGNDTALYQNTVLDYCYDVPQEDVVVDGETLFTNSLIGVTPVCEFNSGKLLFLLIEVHH
jgi:hypothetical protein